MRDVKTAITDDESVRFERAAVLCGLETMSSFLRQSAVEKANRVLEEEAVRQARIKNAGTTPPR